MQKTKRNLLGMGSIGKEARAGARILITTMITTASKGISLNAKEQEFFWQIISF